MATAPDARRSPTLLAFLGFVVVCGAFFAAEILLLFLTETGAPPEPLFRHVEIMLRHQPAWLRSRWTLGTLLVIYNWALATFAWYLLFVEDDAGE